MLNRIKRFKLSFTFFKFYFSLYIFSYIIICQSKSNTCILTMAAAVAGLAFIPYYNQIMEILETNQELKKTAKGIFTQMSYAAGGCMLGGAFGGPAGAMIGGIAGSLYGYTQVEDYDSMVNILKTLSDREKQELVEKIQALVGSSSIEALTTFIGQQVNRELFANLIRDFAKGATKGG